MFFEVAPSGEIVGQPRHVGETLVAYWDLLWLPDSRGVIAVGDDGNLRLIPVDPNQRPVALTQDDPNPTWSCVLSPDGRYIAYSSEISRGNSVWRVDLDGAVRAGGS